MRVKDADGTETVEIVKINTTLPPEVSAIKYFLNNRNSKMWTEKIESRTGMSITINLDKDDINA
jgi:hypothetical protein